MQKQIVLQRNNQNLYGMLHLPAGPRKGRAPVVVLCHGFSSDKVEPHRIFVKMARALAEQGIAALRFDYLGTGDSDGDFEDMTIAGEIADTLCAMDWLEQNAAAENIDTGRMGLLGFSLGGLVASCVAGRDKRVKALTLWGPVSDLQASNRRVTEQRAELLQDLPGGKIDYAGNVLGPAFIAEIGTVQPLAEIKKYPGPVLIVHGTEDQTEPATNAKAYQDALANQKPGPRVVLVGGSDHTFSSQAWEQEVLDATAKFFAGSL